MMQFLNDIHYFKKKKSYLFSCSYCCVMSLLSLKREGNMQSIYKLYMKKIMKNCLFSLKVRLKKKKKISMKESYTQMQRI